MIQIQQASIADIPTIQDIAHKTWPDTYGTILSSEQLEYMLDKFYSDESLTTNFQNNHLFFIVYENDIPMGFAGIEHYYQGLNKTRIHKLYILPSAQGKGIGKLLLTKIVSLAQQEQSDCLNLNVNRFNAAVGFYKKQGFVTIKEYDLEIGNGYLMEDFEMEKMVTVF